MPVVMENLVDNFNGFETKANRVIISVAGRVVKVSGVRENLGGGRWREVALADETGGLVCLYLWEDCLGMVPVDAADGKVVLLIDVLLRTHIAKGPTLSFLHNRSRLDFHSEHYRVEVLQKHFEDTPVPALVPLSRSAILWPKDFVGDVHTFAEAQAYICGYPWRWTKVTFRTLAGEVVAVGKERVLYRACADPACLLKGVQVGERSVGVDLKEKPSLRCPNCQAASAVWNLRLKLTLADDASVEGSKGRQEVVVFGASASTALLGLSPEELAAETPEKTAAEVTALIGLQFLLRNVAVGVADAEGRVGWTCSLVEAAVEDSASSLDSDDPPSQEDDLGYLMDR